MDWFAVSGAGTVTGRAASQIGEVLSVELNHLPQTLDFSATNDDPLVFAQGPASAGATRRRCACGR